MDRLASRIRTSDFLRHNLILFCGSIAISILNYLYYPVLGRMLEPAAFGEVQTIISLFLQIAIFLNVLALLTIHIVANHGDKPEAQRTIFELERMALGISLAGLVVTVVAGRFLQSFFQFDSIMPFILLALAVTVSVPGAFRMAYLRGKKLFGRNSVAGMIAAAAKLGLAVAFIVAGFGVTGAIFGLVLAQAVSFAYAAKAAGRAGFGPSMRSDLWRKPDFSLVRPHLKYAGLVLAGSLAITALYSIDIIAAKHYFDAHTAGVYAGIATVARIIFFLTGSVAQVLIPSVSMNRSARHNLTILRNSSLLLTGLGGLALLAFWAAPELVMRLLMGNGYAELAHLLPRLSAAIFTVSLLNLFVQYHMALRRYAIGIIMIIGLAATCGLVGINHGSPQAIVDSMLAGSLISLGLLASWALCRAIMKRGENVQGGV